jgi:hypothetical protein
MQTLIILNLILKNVLSLEDVQGDSNMIGTDFCVNKPQSVPVIFEPPCIFQTLHINNVRS